LEELEEDGREKPRYAAYPRLQQSGPPKFTAEELKALAGAYRGLSIAATLWLVSHMLVLGIAPFTPAAGFLLVVASLIFGVTFGYVLSNHGRAFGLSSFLGLVFGVFLGSLPFVNILILAMFANRLQEKIKSAGVKLGLMGPDRTSLALAIHQADTSPAKEMRFDGYAPVSREDR
jgi:hypothetical protein